MMYAKMTRNLESFGRVVIPKDTLTTCNIVPHDSVEFFIDAESRTIALRKYSGHSCTFCNSSEELSHFKGSLICKNCTYTLKII
ncbi:peptidase A2 [Paenibacillus kribbensis]|uniref:Peptidase A2 n=1 Tax=Paenibacillus kribbensis TaxID=172713 RepID=A0A222WTP3_9BACL|nr:peptidase A2 [Paenibacillus kribbensis]